MILLGPAAPPKPESMKNADTRTQFETNMSLGINPISGFEGTAQNPFGIPQPVSPTTALQVDSDIAAAEMGIEMGIPGFTDVDMAKEIMNRAYEDIPADDVPGNVLLNDPELDGELRAHESTRFSVYPDSKQIPTVGIGANLKMAYNVKALEAMGVNVEALMAGEITLQNYQVEALFKVGKRVAMDGVRKATQKWGVQFDALPYHIQKVLFNMAFNLGGSKLGKFENTIKAAGAGDWEKMVVEMADSGWWTDVGDRAWDLARMVVTNPSDYVLLGRDNYKKRVAEEAKKAAEEAKRVALEASEG